MQPDTQVSSKGKIESLAYYIYLATAVLTPLFFIPSPYIALDLAKTIIIALGTLVSAILYGIVFWKEKEINAPPRGILCTSFLTVIALVVSSILSIQVGKSLFGQGFEVGTAGINILFFLFAWVSFEVIRRDRNRGLAVYSLVTIAYLILVLFHVVRLMTGPGALSLGILSTLSATVLGKWYDLAIYSIVITIITSSAILFMPLTKKMRVIYWVIGVVSFLMAFLVNHRYSWLGAAITFALLTIGLYRNNKFQGTSKFQTFWKRIPWIPTIIFVVAVLLTFQGANIAGSVIQKTGTQYTELALPWQMTIDVVGGAIKNYPWFGVGPNHFSQAFMAYKPLGFNSTDAWSVEFSSGSSVFLTGLATLGLVGGVLWLLLVIFIGIIVTKTFRNLPEDSTARFYLVSGATATMFLWFMAFLYMPSHSTLLLTFLITGAYMASCVNYGIVGSKKLACNSNFGKKFVFPAFLVIAIVLAVLGGVVYLKKTIALTYFGKGVKLIATSQNYTDADTAFRSAITFDESDVYWQAVSENARLNANQLITTATSSSSGLITTISNLVNVGVSSAKQAIAYDPTNYYNYVSEARVSQLAASIKIPGAYENTIQAYTNAIRLNPQNPSLYVSLAQVQAAGNNLDGALQTIGAALQVKSNYLDAVFLLSQIHAAKGNLADAITAASVATQINPNNPLLFFQLGLLEYNAKNYAIAGEAMKKAVALQSDYANARYFLGLSLARQNDLPGAIEQFEILAKTNTDNQEIAFILNNLRAGKSPFSDAKPPVTSAPEKRATLPVKEKR